MTEKLSPNDLSTVEIVRVYNTIADRPVKKFESRGIAVTRLELLLEKSGMELAEVDGQHVARVSSAEVDPAEDAEPTSVVRGQHVEQGEAPTHDWLVRRPTTEARRAVVTAAPGRPVRGRHSGHPEAWRIEVVSRTNPKKAGSAAALRFEQYGSGCTVGEFLDRCVALGHHEHRHQYRADIHWDIRHGYVRVVAPAEVGQ